MRQGIDPKHKSVADATLKQVLDAYLTARSDLSLKSAVGYRNDIERQLEPWLELPMRSITREMVEDKHRKIAASVAKGGRYNGKATANGTMRALRALWNFQSDRLPSNMPSMPTNPVRLRKQWFEVPRRERLIKADELAAFYSAVTNKEIVPNEIQAAYLLLLLFTGLRREEAAQLRWEHIDFSGRLIRLPAANTKARRKLALPMTDFVYDLLVARRAIGIAEFVFPSGGKRGHIAEPKFPLGLVEKATGIEVSAHDLRRTYITVAESTDMSAFALKALVNYSLNLGGDVTGGYIDMTIARLREPAQKICDRLKELCAVPAPSGENVERLRG